MTIDNRRHQAFAWEIEDRDSRTSLRLRGELDLPTVAACKAPLFEALQRPAPVVVVDLSELSFIDSTGLRLLLDLKRALELAGTKLKLGEISAPAARVLEISGVDSWFETDRTSRSGQAS